jgi:ATP-dependent DNA ligase
MLRLTSSAAIQSERRPRPGASPVISTKGELVIWNAQANGLDFTALQRRLASAPRATPATRDQDVAAVWLRDYSSADVGIEGLVIKGLAQPYRPDARVWLKLRSRTTAEAIVGAVTGSRALPDRLILGLLTPTGELVVAGGTAQLSLLQQRQVAPHLRAARTHPWPTELPPGRMGSFGRSRALPVTRVQPTLVVEIHADSAFEYGRWRRLTRFARPRPDLSPDDLTFLWLRVRLTS